MLSFSVISSGSKGNATIVRSAKACILIDCGISYRQLTFRLAALGLTPAAIDAVCLTHEHSDHIRGLGTFLAKHPVPLFCNEATFLCASQLCEINTRPQFVRPGSEVCFRDLTIDCLPVPHDAADPLVYFLSSGAAALGVVTDLGELTPAVSQRVKSLSALVIEANHDEEMLLQGRYPLHLKRRIAGSHGHLSNSTTSELVAELSHQQLSILKCIVAAHLSEDNNLPELAHRALSEGWTAGRSVHVPQLLTASARVHTDWLSA